MALGPTEHSRSPLALWLSLACCLALPPIWNALLPRHVGGPITVALTPPRADDRLSLPEDRIEARPWERPETDASSVGFEFDLDGPGPYSLYGISSHTVSAPLSLWIDGKLVSTRAFYAATGSLREDFERSRIATGVALTSGTHTLELRGNHTSIRTFVLELQREAPLGPLRYLALALAAALALTLRRLFVARTLEPEARLLATASFAFAPAALALLAVAQAAGTALISTNTSALSKAASLKSFESHLDSEVHRARGSRFSVAVLGDSTHFFALEEGNTMLPAIERALRRGERRQIQLYGVAARAFSAFDYYLLLNRLVAEEPDLVVIPVNLRSFGEGWIGSAGHDFASIVRYLRADELMAAPATALGRRRLTWEYVLARRIDAAVADGRFSLLLRGVRRQLRAEAERLAGSAAQSWLVHPAAPVPAARAWPLEIPSDHPMLAFFRAINRLAARHGVEILYYTVQVNVGKLAERGTPLDLPGLYAQIEREIAGGSGIHYLDLSRDNPPWMFLDASEHLTERGIQAVAEKLARRIGEIHVSSATLSTRAEVGAH